MGRVLLAGMSEEQLTDYLAAVRLEPLTARTVSSVAALRGEVARARTQGWALVNQELEEGLRALAVPIRDRSGTVVAALNVSAHASRTSLEAMRREEKVYVHCAYGRHRSVALAASILIAQGQTPTAAMALIKQRRAVADPDAFYIRGRILSFAQHWSENGIGSR